MTLPENGSNITFIRTICGKTYKHRKIERRAKVMLCPEKFKIWIEESVKENGAENDN